MPTTVGFSEQNKPFNRFKNIAPCKMNNNECTKCDSSLFLSIHVDDENMIVLHKRPNMELCEREYINATHIDVSG